MRISLSSILSGALLVAILATAVLADDTLAKSDGKLRVIVIWGTSR